MTQGKDSKWLERVVFTGDFLFFKFQISGLNILEQMLSISIPSRKPRCYEVLHVLCNKCIFPKKIPIRPSRKERIVMHHNPNFAPSTSRRWHTHCESIRPGGKRDTRSLLVGPYNDQPPASYETNNALTTRSSKSHCFKFNQRNGKFTSILKPTHKCL